MKIAVIDIGSNSVRLMMWQDGTTLYKALNTTRLGEGTASSRTLTRGAIERTVKALVEFNARAREEGAERVYAFATEAVRSATNGGEFTGRVKEACGLNVEVLSGEQEAAMGAAGVLCGSEGVVVDVGGASSEVILSDGEKTVFSYSLPIGSVRLFDIAGRDLKDLSNAIDCRICAVEYPNSQGRKVCAIGGTATTVASVYHGLKVYDPKIIHGTEIGVEEVGKMAERFLALPVEEVKNIAGMEPRRADVIGGGTLLLYKLLKAVGAREVTISESDNLEGYIITNRLG